MDALPLTSETVALAIKTLKDGGLVGLPTETVYGLAADATNGKAVARIFEAKGRPSFNPLISHVTGLEMATEHGDFNSLATRLTEAFWPGPLTLVVPIADSCAVHPLASAGLDTIALRAPAHSGARQILHGLARPLAAPSANPSGKLSPTRAHHVVEGLGEKVDLVLEGGICAIGLESTVVQVKDDSLILLREGGITREDLIEATGVKPERARGEIRSPGQLLKHYAPEGKLRLNAEERQRGEFMIGFGNVPGDITLSGSAVLEEAAQRLFAALAEANAAGAKAIAIAPIPETGLGRAINDRLRRAAATTSEDDD